VRQGTSLSWPTRSISISLQNLPRNGRIPPESLQTAATTPSASWLPSTDRHRAASWSRAVSRLASAKDDTQGLGAVSRLGNPPSTRLSSDEPRGQVERVHCPGTTSSSRRTTRTDPATVLPELYPHSAPSDTNRRTPIVNLLSHASVADSELYPVHVRLLARLNLSIPPRPFDKITGSACLAATSPATPNGRRLDYVSSISPSVRRRRAASCTAAARLTASTLTTWPTPRLSSYEQMPFRRLANTKGFTYPTTP